MPALRLLPSLAFVASLTACGSGGTSPAPASVSPVASGAQPAPSLGQPEPSKGVGTTRSDGGAPTTLDAAPPPAVTDGAGATDSGSTPDDGAAPVSGTDCCGGACQPTAQFCDPSSCQCATQGTFDLSQAAVFDSPPDIASWPVTTTITRLDIESTGFHVEFSKQNDPDRWPDVLIPGWDGGNLQYTLWSVERISGSWATSGPIEYWSGLYESGGPPSGLAVDWYYDSRWGPLAGYQPQVGELVGFFVTAGNARNITSDDPSQSTVMERSNVVVVPFPSDTGQNFTF